MALEHIKSSVHRMTNHLQLVLSFLEMEQYHKALAAVKTAIKELQGLAKQLTGFVVAQDVPDDKVVVVPEATTIIRVDPEQQASIVVVPVDAGVVHPSDVKRGVTADKMHLVDKSDLKPGRHIGQENDEKENP